VKRLIGLEQPGEGRGVDMKIFTMSFVALLLLASNCFLGWLHFFSFFASHMIQFHVVLSEFPLFNHVSEFWCQCCFYVQLGRYL
jgi:hypothetical protein